MNWVDMMQSIAISVSGKIRRNFLAVADELIRQGHLLEDRGSHEKALAKYRAALRIVPDHPRAHLNMGNAFLSLERVDEAIVHYRAAVDIDPSYSFAYSNLGNALRKANRPDHAITAYSSALQINPGLVEAMVGLGCVYEDQGQLDLAIEQYREAAKYGSDSAGAHFNLGRMLLARNDLDDAMEAFRRAVAIKPEYVEAHWQLAQAYNTLGDVRRTLDHLHAARHLEPGNYSFQSAELLNMNYDAELTNEAIFLAHAAYGKAFGAQGGGLPIGYATDALPNRRLRVGYVSGDFRHHPIVRFMEPLLERHDRNFVEIYCYSSHEIQDAVTARLKPYAGGWREIFAMSDDEAAELIRADQVDILVDLSGHTGHQRLGVFARRPAPVQATWLGYLATTGLREMDYRICDTYTDPPGLTEKYHTEKLARLPDCLWCYRPPENLPEPSSLPMLENGYITFGSFNNIAKLNQRVLELWARLLRAVPDARLIIGAMPPSGIAESRIIGALTEQGIDPVRVDVRQRQAALDYLRAYREVDVALDPFPYNGGTTSIDGLYQGVPFITLTGSRSISRGGVSILSNLGLAEFIARDEDEYIEIARYWAQKPSALMALRATLPERTRASPLGDEAQFARNVENLYRNMWKAWLPATAHQ